MPKLKKNKNMYREMTKFNIYISFEMLSEIFYYSTYDHKLITKKGLRNLSLLMNSINEREYEERNRESYTLLKVIIETLRIRLEKNINNIELLIENLADAFPEIDNIRDNYFSAYFDEDFTYEEIMSVEDILYINYFVESRLTYRQIFIAKDSLEPIFAQLSDTTVSLDVINKKFMSEIEHAFSACMLFKAETEHALDDFELYDEDKSNYVLQRTVEEYNKPNSKIVTGLQTLNMMLDGGWEGGRFYNVCAVTKGWKSGFLLDAVMWGIKYNSEFSLKNPNKIPTIFYFTLENSVRETINRIYVYLTGKGIKYLTNEEALQVMNKEIREKYNVNLVIKYKPPKSVSTMDFSNMIDEIESGNNEVVFAVLDYTKRIKSTEHSSEIRLELAQVADDLCTIAKAKNIPILSASQLNRVAYQAVENAIAKGKKDIIKELNTSHIGESVGLIENPDVVFFINKEIDEITGEKWLSFKMVASRIETEDERGGYSFVQKFDNGMKLEEDFGLDKPLSKKSISGDIIENFDPNRTRAKIEERNSNGKPKLKSRKVGPPRGVVAEEGEDTRPAPAFVSNIVSSPIFEEEDDDRNPDDFYDSEDDEEELDEFVTEDVEDDESPTTDRIDNILDIVYSTKGEVECLSYYDEDEDIEDDDMLDEE